MASYLEGRIKRLEKDAGDLYRSAYVLLPGKRKLTAEDWLELHFHRDKNHFYELMPLAPRAYVREFNSWPLKEPLRSAIDRAKATGAEVWICSDLDDAYKLKGERAKANAFSHAFVFSDLNDELGLGPGRHRIGQ